MRTSPPLSSAFTATNASWIATEQKKHQCMPLFTALCVTPTASCHLLGAVFTLTWCGLRTGSPGTQRVDNCHAHNGPETPRSARAAVTCCDWLVSFSSHISCSTTAKKFWRQRTNEASSSKLSTCVGTPRRCPMIFAMLATDQCDVGPGCRCLADPHSTQSVCCPQLALFVTMDESIPTASSRCHCCMEELQEWIARRQADLKEAMLVGRPDEVARISNIMCSTIGNVIFSYADAFHHRWLCDIRLPFIWATIFRNCPSSASACTGGGGENCCICFNASKSCSASRMHALSDVDKNPSHSLTFTSSQTLDFGAIHAV